MAKVAGGRDVQQVSPRVASDPGLRIASGAFQGGGEALARAGKDLSDIGSHLKKIEDAENAAQLARAKGVSAVELAELEKSFEGRNDHEVFDEEFKEKSQEILERNGAGIKDSGTRSVFTNDFGLDIRLGALDVDSTARKQRVDQAGAERVIALDALADAAARAKTPEEQKKLTLAGRVLLAKHVEAGVIGEDDAAKVDLSYRSSIEERRVNALITADPKTAAARLADPAEYPDLDVDKRLLLADRAERRAETLRKEDIRLAEAAEAKSERMAKEAREQRFGEIADDLREGRSIDIRGEMDARKIDGQQLVALENLQARLEKGESIPEDRNVINALQEKVDEGNLTREEVLNSFSSHDIDEATMNRFNGEIDQGTSAVVKQERAYMKAQVVGITGPFATLDAEKSRRFSEADREFNDRIAKGEDPREVADDVARRFSVTEQTTGSSVPPRFMVGTRNDMDIEATKQAAFDALQNKLITRTEFDKEAETIKKWEAIQAERAAATQAREDRRSKNKK